MGFITTADIAALEGIKQRTIQKRIRRLGIVPQLAGSTFLLTSHQAERVRRDKRKPCRKPKPTNGNGSK
jgi:hypothetical protein